jgi:hypothetical protein
MAGCSGGVLGTPLWVALAEQERLEWNGMIYLGSSSPSRSDPLI